ncbi:ABC transporter permease subunit [Vibrio rumoiensis]|uniref:Phosphate ABC transporter permease n=1 Tax=Vibrio rumoiensis 1S-45 TaxID=1188252 RepID=A0A1E5E5F9_9VIBR|nr:ABC transporter permease subunit [Vibrio rumoiensis]OEF28638.1 phosphate ABC transporter permease [Vibrio rumoiensis 1S-45]
MAQVDTFFKQRDKRRWVTDRLASSVIRLGGISVLLALVLLIFYLIIVIAPIFYPASITSLEHKTLPTFQAENPPVAVGIDDEGKTAFTFSKQGQLSFTYLGEKTGKPAKSLLKMNITTEPTAFRSAVTNSRWYAYATQRGQIIAVHPKFSNVFTADGRHSSPSVSTFVQNPVQLDKSGLPITSFDFAINVNDAIFVGRSSNGDWQAVAYSKPSLFNQARSEPKWIERRLQMPPLKIQVKDYRVTPDGKTLYVLSENAITILKRQANQFEVRETVPLSTTDKNRQGVSLELLSGAYSLLLTDQSGQVSQWFDVLKNGERHFTHIRDFALSPNVEFLLPDYYRKGFYSFHQNGVVENFYTTSHDRLLSKRIEDKTPLAAGTSSSENYLITANRNGLNVYTVNNPHPEISFSSLWQKIWYEGYPKPEYIWQSTAASNDFEAKFSLVPIAFGTLKSAIFAMIFAVPISICGAIYTAYFMTARMRRYVKPTIELMEALPTVIIGFLAGLWLAPIIEMNLLSTILFMLFLPIVILLAALLWHMARQLMGIKAHQGWIALMLIPVVIGFGLFVVGYGHHIEHWLFGGDVRLFMANNGINFDQRNALIVGFAMGFAVIPTIFTIAEDAIFSVPKHLSDGASALGATPWQCLTTVVLVTASPGIFSAVMMGLGRAVGETMIVLMATGNTPVMDWNIFEGMRTLSANIAIEMPESEVGGSHFRLLFLSAFLLFVFTFVVNSIAELVRQRLREKYSAL